MGLIGAGAKVVAQCKHSFEFLRPSGQATADRNGVGLAGCWSTEDCEECRGLSE